MDCVPSLRSLRSLLAPLALPPRRWKEWYSHIDNTAALERRIREWGEVTHFRQMAQFDINDEVADNLM